MSLKAVPPNAPTLEEIFSPGGILDRRLPGYEFRPSQLKMAEAVLDALRFQGHLCVEAGTGTGKTLAYLIPALFSQRRVVVSTATKNLQEQIFFKDVPFIQRNLRPDLKAVCMKGRRNYLCLKRLQERLAQGALFQGARQERLLLEDWSKRTETGDRAELDWLDDKDPRWPHLDARSETCLGGKCPSFDQCFITRMRQEALEADIIVVNHALFFANLALQSDEIGQILPDFGSVILDEAHEIEDIAASHFGAQLSSYQLEDLGRDFHRVFSEPKHSKRASQAVEAGMRLFAACPALEGCHSLTFFRDSREGTIDLRDRLQPYCRDFRQAVEDLYHGLMAQERLPDEAESLIRRLEQLLFVIETIFEIDDYAKVYWFERRGRGVFFRVTPIQVAQTLREHLFEKVDCAVLTSATLAVDQEFTFVRERLGVPDPGELVVPSEFDFQRQAMLYVPSRFPEPRSDSYVERALGEIEGILRITQGSAFLLFTSLQQMNRFHERLLERIEYPLLRQGDRPKTRLLELFKSTSGAVLCATASFWQGVDVRGDALRAVIIDKLPFQVPTEPVVAARLHHLRQEGLDPFASYTVPEAIISLKQGIGRLIRSRRDRGILAIFDSRIRTRSYGRAFLQSLPNCPLTDKIEDLKNFYRQSPSTLENGSAPEN